MKTRIRITIAFFAGVLLGVAASYGILTTTTLAGQPSSLSELEGWTFFLGGAMGGVDENHLYITVRFVANKDELISLDITKGAAPFICSKEKGCVGTGWSQIPNRAPLCAVVHVMEDGKPAAGKVFFNSTCAWLVQGG